MKKNNKKKKIIMRLAGMFLFVLALILTLDLIFNDSKDKIKEKYAGVWMIGYEIYDNRTDKKLQQIFEQEMHLLRDGTFFTKEQYISYGDTDNKVSGTYKIINNKIILKYEQNGKNKEEKLIIKDNKLCLTDNCYKYYTLDKIEKYFPVYENSIENNGTK